MRSELNELALIDNYLLQQLDEKETNNVETSIILNESFAAKVEAQRMAHRLVRLHGQKCYLESIYQYLMQEPAFSNQIKNLV